MALLVLFYVLLVFLAPRDSMQADINYWITWTNYITADGLGKIYTHPDVNYNPGILYLLKIFGSIQGSDKNVTNNIGSFRNIILVFDMISLFLVAWISNKNKLSPYLFLVFAFNIVFFYNTLLWEQVDTVHTLLILSSIIAGIYRRPVLSLSLLLIALNVKLQSIIYIPLVIIISFPSLYLAPRKILYTILALAVTETIIILPFIISGQTGAMINMNFGLVNTFKVASMNAFNFWHWVLPSLRNSYPSDDDKFWGITYKMWGLIMFCISSFFVLLPLMLKSLNEVRKKIISTVPDYKIPLLSAALMTLVFFFFNTEMHERYSHPAILFAGIFCILEGNYIIYFLISLAYFLNMERVLHFLRLNNYNTFIFEGRFVATIFAVTIILLFFKLYRNFALRKEINLLFSRGKTNDIIAAA